MTKTKSDNLCLILKQEMRREAEILQGKLEAVSDDLLA